MSGIEIVLTVVSLACVFILTALLVVYLSSKKNNNLDEDVAEEPKMNISEPVLSFIETFKNNHRRFLITLVTRSEHLGYSHTKNYTLLDKQTSEEWVFSVTYRQYGVVGYNFPSWLTNNECRYIFINISGIYFEREKRMRELNRIKKDRLDSKERDRLKLVYCNK